MRFVPAFFVAVGLLLPAGAALAKDEDDFWTAYKDSQKMEADIRKEFTDEARRVSLAKAAKKEAKNKFAGFNAIKHRAQKYEKYIAIHSSAKGMIPFVKRYENSILMMHIRCPQFGKDVGDLEKLLRSRWKKDKIQKGYRTAAYVTLYNRYMLEKKWKDAVRVADECYMTYDWTWADARSRLAEVIRAASCDSDLDDLLYKRIDEFHARYSKQLYTHRDMSIYLNTLIKHRRWDQGASIADDLLASYKDCDWEPIFLSLAVKIHTERWNANVAEQMKAEAAAAAVEGGAGDGEADAAKKAKPPKQKSKIKRTYKPRPRRPYKGNSAVRSLEIGTRAIKRYPYSPETYNALRALLDWACNTGKGVPPETVDAVFDLVAQHLSDHTTTPHWNVLWQRGSVYAKKLDKDWSGLEAVVADVLEENKVRSERWKELRTDEDKKQDPKAYAQKLIVFIQESPESTQARTAAAELLKVVTSAGQRIHIKENVPVAAAVLEKAFRASPAFLSGNLQRMADACTLKFLDFIYDDYIRSTRKGLMQEYYYLMRARRPLKNDTYDVKLVTKYVKAYPNSYGIPKLIRDTAVKAIYERYPEDAAKVTLLLRNERYKNSMVALYTLQNQIVSWIPAARRKIATFDKKWQRKWANYDAFFAVEPQKVSFFLDKYFTGRLELAAMYVNIMRACPKMRLKKCRNKMAAEVLKEDPYKEGFCYYYYRIYNR